MTKNIFGRQIVDFFDAVEIPKNLPPGVSILNPYEEKAVRDTVDAFYTKYFNDTDKRVFIIGINPGRLGGGTTGIAFTDSPALKLCGIATAIPETKELSADFVYRCIDAYGGPEQFYRDFFITSASPIGFVKEGRNFNYYDDTAFTHRITPYIAKMLGRQKHFGAYETALVLGKGKNYRTLLKLNEAYGLFRHLIPLDHPRFVMQYRRKKIDEYIKQYQQAFQEALSAG